jgi:tripartite-type tricarboxylate transporter receptor subunit TctC
MKLRSIAALLLATGVALVASNSFALAQSFPTRSVKLVVPYPAGGGVDGVARLIAERLSTYWGHPVIVENRAGANGNIGGDYVAKSPPDGYTILFSPSPVYTTAKLLYPNLSFDPDTELKPVMLAAVTPNVIMVTTKLPITTLQELIAYAKSQPGQVTYASQGIGSTAHLTAAYLAQVAQLEMRHVPYRGAAPALTDVVAGHVTMTVDGLSSALGVIRAGSIRALVVASAKRSAALPDLPTATEAGLPGFESESWYGVTVPGQTPDSIVKIIRDGMAQAFREPDISKSLTERGANIIASTPAELAAYMKADTERWKKVIDAQNIKLQQ